MALPKRTIEVPALIGDRAWMLHPVNYGDSIPCAECGGSGRFESPSGKQKCQCDDCNGRGHVAGERFDVYYATPVVCTWLSINHHRHDRGAPDIKMEWSEAFADGHTGDAYRGKADIGPFASELEAVQHAKDNGLRWALRMESKRPKWAKMAPELKAIAGEAYKPKKNTLQYH